VAPQSPYAQAKYSAELYLGSLSVSHRWLRATSLRLSSLSAPDIIGVGYEAVSSIVTRLIRGEAVVVQAGEQRLERTDVRDAADAIALVAESDSGKWLPVFNMGPGVSYPLNFIVDTAVSVGRELAIDSLGRVVIFPAEGAKSVGMDSTTFCRAFGWSPQIEMRNMLEAMILASMEEASKSNVNQ
jgi:nucleoside-diphosphate-sugar epimerase